MQFGLSLHQQFTDFTSEFSHSWMLANKDFQMDIYVHKCAQISSRTEDTVIFLWFLSCNIILGRTDGEGWDSKIFLQIFSLPMSPHRRYLSENIQTNKQRYYYITSKFIINPILASTQPSITFSSGTPV